MKYMHGDLIIEDSSEQETKLQDGSQLKYIVIAKVTNWNILEKSYVAITALMPLI